MKSFIFGYTRNQLPIMAYRFGSEGPRVLLLGGVHGDEVEGIALAQFLLGEFAKSFFYKIQLVLVPCLNMDGSLAGTRQNALGVDLNRNLPTKDWTSEVASPRYHPGFNPLSEPENKALVTYFDLEKVDFILSLHSYSKVMVNVNGNCEEEAQVLSKYGGYPVTHDMGYPTPGSLGAYAGLENNMPTITYELLRGGDIKELCQTHSKAIKEFLKFYEGKK